MGKVLMNLAGEPMLDPGTDQQIAPIVVGGKHIGPGAPTFFVAEEGQANNGDLQVALKMIGIAAAAGADAIEFQLAIADDFYVRTHPYHKLYTRREFDRVQLEELFACAADTGIIAFATVLSRRLVPVVIELGCPLLNVTSSDLDNPDMLDAVVEAGCPFFISTAMATLEEVDWAVERVRQHGATNFALLHGQHVMTTAEGRGVPEDQTNLATMASMQARYGVPVGFIDHTSSPYVPAIAAARGAAIVSKHFTWDRSVRGPDWHVCLEPEELAHAIHLVRIADQARGNSAKDLIEGEQADRAAMRRSIVAAADLPAGTELGYEHLAFKRPGTGLSPKYIDQVVGQRLQVALKADDQLQLDHLA